MNPLSRLYYRIKDWMLYHLHPDKTMLYQDIHRSKVASKEGDPVAVWRASKRPSGFFGITAVQSEELKRPVLKIEPTTPRN